MISGYIIAYKDETTIKKSLESLYGLCNEIIVCMETKSGDSTRSIIEQEQKKHSEIKLYDYTMQGDWSEARNFALSKCSGDWIITVDGDEWFDEKGKAQIQKLINADCDVWEVIQYSFLIDGEILLTPATRIFKSGLRYTLPTHETLIDSINENNYRVGKSNVIMYHTGYYNDTKDKITRNYAILKEDHPLFHYYTGVLQVKNNEDGIPNLLKSLETTNNNSLKAYIYIVLAEAYLKQSEIYSAVSCLRESLKIESIQNTAHKLLADIYINVGMLDEAINELEAIKENSKILRCRIFNDRIFSNIQEAIEELTEYKQKIKKEIKCHSYQ